MEHDHAKNHARFAPLHEGAERIVRTLLSEFQVERIDAYGLDPELEGRCRLARPSIQLSPENPSSAPIVVSFSLSPEFSCIWVTGISWLFLLVVAIPVTTMFKRKSRD